MSEATRETIVEVDGLRRSYGRLEVVRGVSLEVRRGELFALLGTNGAGKTTTIEVLEGLRRPSAGQVRVFGVDPVRDRAVVRRRTGMMLQSGGFTGTLTVGETVELWRALTPHPRPAAEVLELVELERRREVAVEQLSGGERRRLELALAVLGRPELVFLDEPTSGMDPASRRRTWEVVRELQSDGATVLLTTHYLEEAEALADRVAIMHEGAIVVCGPPDEVVQRAPARITDNPLFILLALILAAAVMAAFSAALSAVTRSSEAAMLTSLPTVGLFLATPGVLVPLGDYPAGVEAVAKYLPLGPFTELIRDAWSGGELLDMAASLGVLGIWLVLAALLGRAVFRWEPRAT
jgi:ABC-2 type transport system ATP-binding protein